MVFTGLLPAPVRSHISLVVDGEAEMVPEEGQPLHGAPSEVLDACTRHEDEDDAATSGAGDDAPHDPARPVPGSRGHGPQVN